MAVVSKNQAINSLQKRAQEMGVEYVSPQEFHTAYQQNLSKSTPNRETPDSYRKQLSRIKALGEQDSEAGKNAFNMLQQLRSDPASRYYNPYAQATNRSVSALNAYGIDTSNMDDAWREQMRNTYGQYYLYNGTTNTPSKPGKKASLEEQVAYEFYQLDKSWDDTAKAKQEMAALEDELTYWALRTDLNLSDDEIIQKVNVAGNSNYKTLAKMDSTKAAKTPMELNEAIDYSDDWMHGVLWAARNGGSTGNIYQDMINSYEGVGNTWQDNPEIREKLNPLSENFSPYSVGATGLDAAAVYFNMPSEGFGKNWLNENQDKAYSQDATEQQMYQTVYTAEENTTKAEAALDGLNRWMEKTLSKVTDPEKAKKKLDDALALGYVYVGNEKIDISILNKMDKTIGKGTGEDRIAGTGNLIPMTRPVDYRYADALEKAYGYCERNTDSKEQDKNYVGDLAEKANGTPAQTGEVDAVTGADAPVSGGGGAPFTVPKLTEQENQVIDGLDMKLDEGAQALNNVATEQEQNVFAKTGSARFAYNTPLLAGFRDHIMNSNPARTNLLTAMGQDEIKRHAEDSLGQFQTLYDYNSYKTNVTSWKNEAASLRSELGDKVYAGKQIDSEKDEWIETDFGSFKVSYIYNSYSGRYTPDRITEWGEDVSEDAVWERMNLLGDVVNSQAGTDTLSRINQDAQRISNAANVQMSDEDMAKQQRLRELEIQIEDGEDFLRSNQSSYEAALDEFNAAQSSRQQLMYMMRQAGVDTSALEEEDEAVAYLTQFGDYEATVWNAYDAYEVYHQALAQGHQPEEILPLAENAAKEVQAELDQARKKKAYFEQKGIEIPENYSNNLDRHIAKLEQNLQEYENFKLTQKDDFEDIAAQAQAKEEAERAEYNSQWWSRYVDQSNGGYVGLQEKMDSYFPGFYNEMTDIEKKTYYYLRGIGDDEGANRYLQSLARMSNGVLHTRLTESLQRGVEQYVGSDFLGTNILAVVASPFAAMASLGYMGYTWMTGEELNPDNAMLFLNNFKNFTREDSANEILKTFGTANEDGSYDETLTSKVVQGFYEMVTNRLDSVANGLLFGGLAPAGNAFLNELLSASPMGLSAAMDSISDAKRKGATDAQAWGVGLVTFLAETGTEAISLDNIKDALGKGADPGKTLKDFLHNWLTSGGFSEMFGESANDVIENLADDLIMGEMSNHNQLVWRYRMAGYGKDEAEALALQDGIKNVFHTAVISYLSPGLDIGSFAAGRAGYYLSLTKDYQMQGNNVSVVDVIRGEAKARKIASAIENAIADNSGQGPLNMEAADEWVRNREAEAKAAEVRENGVANGEGAFNLSKDTQQQAPAPTLQENSDHAMADYEMLKNAKGQSLETQSANIAVVFNTQHTQEADDAAHAVAANADKVFSDPLNDMMDLMIGASASGADVNEVKAAIQNAVLAGENSAAWRVMQSEAYQNAAPDARASMLAATVRLDANDQNVQSETAHTVREYRIAMKEAEFIQNGAVDSAIAADQAATNAAKATENAKNRSDAAEGEAQAKREAAVTANEEAINNPTDENTNAADQALREMDHAEKVAESEAAGVTAAEAKQQEAEDNAKRAKEAAMTDVRRQAEDAVAQEDQQRAEAAAQEEETKRKQEETQKAEQEQKRQERAQKSREASLEKARAIGEEQADRRGLEGEKREKFINRYIERAEKKIQQKANMDAKLTVSDDGEITNADGFLTLAAFERKTGVKVRLKDLGDPTVIRGKYTYDKTNGGVVTLNSRMIKEGNLTNGQALVEAALHEFTHAFESTGNYGNYVRTVMGILYGDTNATYENNSDLRADIKKKISDYKSGGIDLTADGKFTEEEGALREIVADYARTNDLANSDTIQRFMDAGLGGRVRNALHNINQALKNFRLSGDEKVQAENLRRAERAYQKALNDIAKTQVHPEAEQFSIAQVAQATGMTFNENTLTLYDSNGNEIDGVNNRITADMITQTPVGLLIDNGLTGKQNADAKEMMAGLMNMVARYKDSDLVWEIGASTLSSTFSALKSNSDPQYATTVDFGTVCAKTQAIIDVLSQVMLDRVKEGKTGGLTREEIIKVYNATHEAGLSVPCPVCYVFSRWMGVPSLLGQMSQFQHDYVVLNEDGSIDKAATQKKVDAYIENAEAKYGDAKKINSRKTKLQGQLASLEEQRVNAKTDAERNEIVSRMTEIDDQLNEVNAYNWVTQALCKKSGDKYVVDSKFKYTPDEILFDLNRTGEFASYEKNWKYRNTRGAGMGKAIMPYSGETIGDVLYGVKSGGRQNTVSNPWLNMDDKAAKRQLKNAIDRAKKQNLVGGQRLQSTSDFRPEWGLDYIMTFLELQAAKSKVQMYTKVPEAVDFFASVGADVNLSIMGKGKGYHIDENGNAVLDFSSITGMDYETAKALKNKYDNVQMILVGMNDTHIRLAMASEDIDFIIPWHSSGNSKETIAGLLDAVKEQLEHDAHNYEDSQTDKFSENRTNEQKTVWEARMKILMGNASKMTQEEWRASTANPYLADLYHRFYEDESSECYGVKLNKAQANQIFPYEYWDTSTTKDQADTNGKRFVEYCESMGIVPRFSQFKDDPGYWKLLIDRPMYNNDKSYHQQQTIDVTNARIGNLDDGGRLTGSDLPTAAQAKYASNDPRSAHYEEYTQKERNAIDAAEAALNRKYDVNSGEQASAFGDVTDADIDQQLEETDEDYLDAVGRGDMEAAAQDVESYAASKGYKEEAYHGTDSFGFTVFDMSASQDEIFVSYSSDTARTYTERGDIKPVSERPKTFNASGGEEIAELFRENIHHLYGHDITDARFVSQEDRKARVEWHKSFMLESLKDAEWTEQERKDAIQLMAPRCNVLPEFFDDCNTPAELQGKIIDEVINGDIKFYPTSYNIMNVVSPVLTMYGKKADGERITRADVREYVYEWTDDFAAVSVENGTIEYEDDTYISYVGLDSAKKMVMKAVGADPGGVYRLYTRPGNQLVVDAEDANWNKIPWRAVIDAANDDISSAKDYPYGATVKTREIAEWARNNGYDSVRINNVFDDGGMSEDDDLDGFGDIGIFFNQADVKSADTATYDDNGKVIPLSERFTDNPDIRYSYGGELTDADIDLTLIEGGAITPEEAGLPSQNMGIFQNDYTIGESGPMPQRQFGSKTAQESDALHDSVKEYLRTHSGYVQDSNQAQIDRAITWVQEMATEGDPDGYHAAVRAVTADSFDYRSADGQARMLTVMAMAAHKAREGNSVALQDELVLADAYNVQGTDLGRQLQARKIFRLMSPVGRVAYVNKMADEINAGFARKGITGEVGLSEWTKRAAAAAETEEDFEKVRKAAASELAKQMPVNWRDRLRSWRMLAMLGNPRTHIRNVVGNAMFIPAVAIKNRLGAAMELASGQENRTKSLKPISSKEIRDFARRDALAMKNQLTGEAKYNEETMVERERKSFKGWLQVLSDFNSNMLEREDWFFLRGHYRRALGGWMEANGYTVEQVKDNPSLLEQGRAYAISEAQKATYRDFSKIASQLNKISREGGVGGFIVDAALPFKKTPANILKRGLEYSPVGIAKALTADAYHLKQYLDYQNGKLKALPDKAISPNQFIDNISSGLTGTAVMALGALLGSLGCATAGLDDDDDEFEKLLGGQEYAIKFKLFGQDVTFTMDWASPMSMPFFVGVSVYEQMRDQDGFSIEEMINAAGNIAEPVFNLSMLDGVNSLFSVSQYDDTNTITQILAKVVSNYATSYWPSVLGATARTIDDTRRKSFVESGKGSGIMGTFRYAREQAENKIPGLSQTNIPYRDAWGNAAKSGLAERILENFLLPGYANQYKNDPVTNEMARVYQATGSADTVPKMPPKYFSAGGRKYTLTAEQWDAYTVERGQTAYNLIGQLMQTDEYAEADNAGKAILIGTAWDYANRKGKEAAVPGIPYSSSDNWVSAEADPLEAIFKKAEKTAKSQKTSEHKAAMIDALDKNDYEGYGDMVEWLLENGTKENTIHTEIENEYKPQYVDAYIKGDYERMIDIQEKLNNTGLEFDTEEWEDEAGTTKVVTRSMPSSAPAPYQADNTPGDYLNHLMQMDEEGTLDQVSMGDFFTTVNQMTGDRPWSVLSDAVGDYVDMQDPNLTSSVAEMIDYLYENGYTEKDIFKMLPQRLAQLRTREKRYGEGKGVKRGEQYINPQEASYVENGVSHLDAVAAQDGSDLDYLDVLNGQTGSQGEGYNPQTTFNGDLSSVESYPGSWLPYYRYPSNEPEWDEDAPEEAKNF